VYLTLNFRSSSSSSASGGICSGSSNSNGDGRQVLKKERERERAEQAECRWKGKKREQQQQQQQRLGAWLYGDPVQGLAAQLAFDSLERKCPQNTPPKFLRAITEMMVRITRQKGRKRWCMSRALSVPDQMHIVFRVEYGCHANGVQEDGT
jgi:hypothetical protein